MGGVPDEVEGAITGMQAGPAVLQRIAPELDRDPGRAVRQPAQIDATLAQPQLWWVAELVPVNPQLGWQAEPAMQARFRRETQLHALLDRQERVGRPDADQLSISLVAQ